MPVSFRPLPALSIVCAILFVVLISLGVWQLQRLHWKLELIHLVARNMHAPPLSLDGRAIPIRKLDTEYLHVSVSGRFDNAKEAYIFGIGPLGAPVFHVVVPLTSRSGQTLLVDRGIVPRDMRNPATRPAGVSIGEVKVVGFWRWAELPGTFTPRPDLHNRIWYSRDVMSIARADNVALAAAGVIEADATPNPGGWPKGGQIEVNIRNEHLQYAITWFLMAAALVGVYLAYHASQGRLTFGKKT
jgi:surfeit locus 1 family protein